MTVKNTMEYVWDVDLKPAEIDRLKSIERKLEIERIRHLAVKTNRAWKFCIRSAIAANNPKDSKAHPTDAGSVTLIAFRSKRPVAALTCGKAEYLAHKFVVFPEIFVTTPEFAPIRDALLEKMAFNLLERNPEWKIHIVKANPLLTFETLERIARDRGKSRLLEGRILNVASALTRMRTSRSFRALEMNVSLKNIGKDTVSGTDRVMETHREASMRRHRLG